MQRSSTPDVVQDPGRFLAGIAALIRSRSGKYLLLRRARDRDVGPGVWECVTGRVNQGESFEQALHREVAVRALSGLLRVWR